MNFTTLQYFLVIYECKSIAQASEKLFVSRQSLTIAMNKLEREIGCPLFIRDSQGTTPVPEADLFYERIQVLLQQWNETLRQLHCLQGGTEPLKVAFSPLSHNFVTESHLGIFKLKYPKIDVVSLYGTSSECWQLLRDESVDVALTYYPGDEEDLKGILMTHETPCLLISASCPQANSPFLTIEDIADKPMLFVRSSDKWLANVKRIWNENGYELNTIKKTDDHLQIAQMVAGDLGGYIVPETSVKHFLSENIVARPIQIPGFECSLYLTMLKEKRIFHAARLFIDFFVRWNRSSEVNEVELFQDHEWAIDGDY